MKESFWAGMVDIFETSVFIDGALYAQVSEVFLTAFIFGLVTFADFAVIYYVCKGIYNLFSSLVHRFIWPVRRKSLFGKVEYRCHECSIRVSCPAANTGVCYPCPHFENCTTLEDTAE